MAFNFGDPGRLPGSDGFGIAKDWRGD